LNIARLPNADVVGDAERLPIAANSIDAVYCEAVFEHLENPELAATEMFRVLKPGSVSFVCTPFMQAFHGYPSHFQNYTIRGHERLFQRAGFRILESGTCVGPAWAVADMVDLFITQYGPRLIRRPARAVWRGFARLFIRPLDKWLGARKDSYAMASTTYVLITKP
jgi:ubiquinone/menaquinone biosynthesis C-methylase UbiE